MTVRQGFVVISVVLLLLLATWGAWWSPANWLFVPLLALGADTVNAARSMLFALGCIQSRSCNTDKCPTGIATQDPARFRQLDVKDKGLWVFSYHRAMIHNLLELLAAAGLEKLEDLRPAHIQHRVGGTVVKNYSDMYPDIPEGCLLDGERVPDDWMDDWRNAHANAW